MEVARIAYSDPRKFYNADGSLKSILELDDDCAATIASVSGTVVGMTRKLKQWDKNAALEKAMKFHGAYERDNAQPNAALAQAVKDAASINPLKAAFAKRLGRA
jgi:phage terminase small subunit